MILLITNMMQMDYFQAKDIYHNGEKPYHGNLVPLYWCVYICSSGSAIYVDLYAIEPTRSRTDNVRVRNQSWTY